MKQLEELKERLISEVQHNMNNLSNVDTKEMGEVIDMIKDLSEAIYHCTIVEAMENKDKEYKTNYYMEYLPPYGRQPYIHDPNREMDMRNGKLYYTESRGINREGIRDSYPMMIRDSREGRSPIVRKNYMESKELHHDKATQMKELEDYMKELSADITEMIADASPEEKIVLKQKMSMLMDKIQ